MRGGIWEGDFVVADIEELEEMDASDLHARRLNAEEVLTPMKGDSFIHLVGDGTFRVSGGDQRLRTSLFSQVSSRTRRGTRSSSRRTRLITSSNSNSGRLNTR